MPDVRAEVATLASVTLLVGSVEPLPVAFFPPVVFAIAIPPLLDNWTLPGYPNPGSNPSRPPGKTTKNNKKPAENL
ncbi:MAG TPA: hypothetical protein VMJ11_03815 [Paraburkholderia sp.]|uniref:hypothetical protein n=1 Tax=Paraburkholderia sp. TaxID=1926495 RepID=UPI002C1A92B7|nr:hypothetical protein [Paraburkholderia sp.]HTR05783.1 hypothetical protein [Paraburkholderia sp.]